MITSLKRKGCVISEIIYIVSLAISLGLSFFVRQELRRREQEKANLSTLMLKKSVD